MSQNTSHAVMAQRVEAHDSLDLFPTPPWATRALCEWIKGNAGRVEEMDCWEPACGFGDMVRPLRESFKWVYATDVHQHGGAEAIKDFLWIDGYPAVDWIITNPPFRLAQQFALTAIERAQQGVALLVRSAFLEGIERHESLFKPRPPAAVLQFSERVVMHKGKLSKDGSTATPYCWVVWYTDVRCTPTTRLEWLPPCRKRLERDSDYASVEKCVEP